MNPSTADAPSEEVIPDWDTECESVTWSESNTFGRGVILSISSKLGQLRELRCVITGPGPGHHRYESVHVRFGRVFSTAASVHFPGEFTPRLAEPWPAGFYAYAWTGDAVDIEMPVTGVLVRGHFHVSVDGAVTCHKEAV